VTCGTSYCPQIAQFIIFLFRQLPTYGKWDLSELDGRVPAQPHSPDRRSVSRISHAVARGRTRFWARPTRGATPPTLPKPLDHSGCGIPPHRRCRRQPEQNAILFGRLLLNRRPTDAILLQSRSVLDDEYQDFGQDRAAHGTESRIGGAGLGREQEMA